MDDDWFTGCLVGVFLILAVVAGITWGVLALFSKGILIDTEQYETRITYQTGVKCTYLIRFSKFEKYFLGKEVCPTLVDVGEGA